jgi:hypothetical protein
LDLVEVAVRESLTRVNAGVVDQQRDVAGGLGGTFGRRGVGEIDLDRDRAWQVEGARVADTCVI